MEGPLPEQLTAEMRALMGFLPNHERAPEQELPRKSGLSRFLELLGRDFWKYFRAGSLALLGAAPFLIGMAFALQSHVLIFAPLAGVIGGAIAGPGLCGLADTILRGLRDEPGFWWHLYRRAWKRNAKASLLPGALGGGLLSVQVFLLFHAGALGLGTAMGGALAAGVLIVLGLSLYVWPQIALVELPFPLVLKNAALLFLGQLPRSLAALAILAVVFGLGIQYFYVSVTLLPFVNFWLPVFPALFLIYPAINGAFKIEETLGGK